MVGWSRSRERKVQINTTRPLTKHKRTNSGPPSTRPLPYRYGRRCGQESATNCRPLPAHDDAFTRLTPTAARAARTTGQRTNTPLRYPGAPEAGCSRTSVSNWSELLTEIRVRVSSRPAGRGPTRAGTHCTGTGTGPRGLGGTGRTAHVRDVYDLIRFSSHPQRPDGL